MSDPRARPVGRATNAAVPTTGTAFAVPKGGQVRKVKVTVSADAYVGVGPAASPPVASATNSGYQDTGTETYVLDLYADGAGYVYVYAVAATILAKLTFLG